MLQHQIHRAVSILKEKGIIVYPTETFFALGGIALSQEVVDRIYEIKKRPLNKPLPLIVGDPDQLHLIVKSIPPLAREIIVDLWPAPLSLLLPAREDLHPALMGKDTTLCVRCPDHPVARRLALDAGSPIISTSANVSGESPCASLKSISREILSKVDGILDAGPAPGGRMPSTIISVSPGGWIRIIREGAYPISSLKRKGYEIVSSKF